jgi:predicted enzyme related to lactoylglutathione lyase
MAGIQVQKVGMIILMERDLDAAISFYLRLGLSLKFRMKEKWAEFDINGVKLGLCPTAQDMQGRRSGFVLEIADVRQAYEELKGEVTFLGEPVEALHGIMVSIQDPGGNVFDLYQPTPEKVYEYAKTVKQEDEGCCGKQSSCKKSEC